MLALPLRCPCPWQVWVSLVRVHSFYTHANGRLDHSVRPGASNLTKTLPLASNTPAQWKEMVSPLTRAVARPEREHCRTQLGPLLLLVREGFPEEVPWSGLWRESSSILQASAGPQLQPRG